MPDSVNTWDEVNINSIQSVYVDHSIGTSMSMSSVSRVTEPAISHPPQVGEVNPRLFQLNEHLVPTAATTLAAAPSTPPASNSNAPFCSTHQIHLMSTS